MCVGDEPTPGDGPTRDRSSRIVCFIRVPATLPPLPGSIRIAFKERNGMDAWPTWDILDYVLALIAICDEDMDIGGGPLPPGGGRDAVDMD